MSVVIKGSEPFDVMIASNIANCQTANIKFKNISFRCETIEDADGTVFVKMPSAQPERKKGTYTESGDDDEWYCRYSTCNECGKEWMGSRNFCPNCGVAMRGEVNEN